VVAETNCVAEDWRGEGILLKSFFEILEAEFVLAKVILYESLAYQSQCVSRVLMQHMLHRCVSLIEFP